jgi:kynurenine formamidase
MTTPPPPLSKREVDDFRQSLSNWGRWGDRDQLGTLNHITAAKRIASARLVRRGRTVGCARPLATQAAVDNPQPAVHLMVATASEGWGGDYFALATHGFTTSHIDALCHIFHEGKLYNGYPTERVTAHGALDLGIHELRHGVVSRGILLDIPRTRDVDFLEPGEPIFIADLERAESAGGIRVEPGDIVMVRTGRWRAREARGARPAGEGLAGLDASCLPWLHRRGVAALGCDGVSDVLPSRVADEILPIHSVAIVTMGLHLLDNLQLDDLAVACIEEGRIEFHVAIAPLVLHQGTASPVNPIALF